MLKGGLNRRGHPAIHSVFTAGADEANTRSVSVTLPKGELLDNAHIGTICTRVDFVRKACPAGSVVGNAVATSPLLGQPLEGPAYLRASDHKLPDLVVELHGQIEIDLVGRIDSVGGRLRTTFEAVPDTPVSKFVLDLSGGSKGLLVNSESLCTSPKSAAVRMRGQNGMRVRTSAKLKVICNTPRLQRHLHDRGGRRKAAGR
jgi:hypothetical protein